MKSAFTHWANLEAARDDSSMNLNYWMVSKKLEENCTSRACLKYMPMILIGHTPYLIDYSSAISLTKGIKPSTLA